MKTSKERPLVRSKALILALILVPVFVIAFIAVLLVQQQHIQRLQERTIALEGQIEEIRAQEAFYKRAYEITLNDVMTLSNIYGGQQRYTERAQELRTQELAVHFARFNLTSWETFSVENPIVWEEYLQRGVIRVDCLPQPQQVEGITNQTLIVVRASSQRPSNLTVYVDGNFISDFAVERNTTRAVAVELPDGGHELSLVSKDGGIEVHDLFFDTTPVRSTTIDYGADWGIFDCQNATPGMMLLSPGASRVLFEKR